MNKKVCQITFLILIIALFTTSAVIAQNTGGINNDITTSSQSTKGLKDAMQEAAPDVKWSVTAGKVIWALVIFLIAYFIIKYLTRFLEALSERWTNTRLTVKRVVPILRILGWIIALYIIIAWIFAPPIETLVALTASVGIAVGFASQDVLKNIFGGVMILFDRPFQVGDKIQVGSHYGEVISIGLRTVRIVTADDSLVSIPNSEIVNQSVSNSNSGESNCQVVAEIYLPIDTDTSKVRDIAYKAAAVSRYVYLNKPITIIFKNEIYQRRPMIKMRLKAYVLDIRFEFNFMSDMTEIVLRELVEQGFVQE